MAATIKKGEGTDAGLAESERDKNLRVSQLLMSGESKRARKLTRRPSVMPYRFTGYQQISDPEGYPAVAPPWGTLNAINLTRRICLEDSAG